MSLLKWKSKPLILSKQDMNNLFVHDQDILRKQKVLKIIRCKCCSIHTEKREHLYYNYKSDQVDKSCSCKCRHRIRNYFRMRLYEDQETIFYKYFNDELISSESFTPLKI